MDMDSFLAQAVRIEHAAEMIYRRSAELIDAAENPQAVVFFDEMAGYAHKHALQAITRAGDGALNRSLYLGDNDAEPESLITLPTVGDRIELEGAMRMALEAEKRGLAFYLEVARDASDPDVRILALEFAAEEREHVFAVEKFLGQRPY